MAARLGAHICPPLAEVGHPAGLSLEEGTPPAMASCTGTEVVVGNALVTEAVKRILFGSLPKSHS